ncbi:Clp protease ClpS [Thiohalorhabdus denitrificans]|uniref:ATP-dependent Clp protease adapter protein ClpS n=1 Tax=Thiohalorhabdus denitrificans TaxID=381306 RepID=A0A0P9GKK5_9GAMM|nr:ATP-dependent Clp protease adapter ClpS [Thiohalorhabdus denitrificans]KPV40662.1 Clp protease ClpS [Thiohalorhabdus denitrificans]SCY47770.1 ATP-dependent Clp protease adaptor protein ClpS [Thiohalorhabdus denitrificans]
MSTEDPSTLTDNPVEPEEEEEVGRPSLYKVLLLNDDFTPMEFVVEVLQRFFGKDRETATRIMLQVHHHGKGVCGVYPYDIAETKVNQVVDYARSNEHPLQCTMEKE